jgi:hypothetical protein
MLVIGAMSGIGCNGSIALRIPNVSPTSPGDGDKPDFHFEVFPWNCTPLQRRGAGKAPWGAPSAAPAAVIGIHHELRTAIF